MQATISHKELADKFCMTGTGLTFKMLNHKDHPKVVVPSRRRREIRSTKKMNPQNSGSYQTKPRATYYEYKSAMEFFARHADWVKA